MTKDNGLVPREGKKALWQRLRDKAGTAILVVVMLIAAILAIPICLLIGLIGCFWNLVDKLLKLFDR